MKYLLLYLEETYGLTNEKKIDNAIGIVANENKYHPIRDYLNTLVWDGTDVYKRQELEKAVNERGISSRTMRTAKSRIGDRLVTEKDGTAWVCYLRN